MKEANKNIITGLAVGILIGVFVFYSLGFWMGSQQQGHGKTVVINPPEGYNYSKMSLIKDVYLFIENSGKQGKISFYNFLDMQLATCQRIYRYECPLNPNKDICIQAENKIDEMRKENQKFWELYYNKNIS